MDRKSKVIVLTKIRYMLVTTQNGNTFDGDEISQGRLLRAINTASITGQAETYWKLANNTKVLVSIEELKEAFVLATNEQSRLWMTD